MTVPLLTDTFGGGDCILRKSTFEVQFVNFRSQFDPLFLSIMPGSMTALADIFKRNLTDFFAHENTPQGGALSFGI